MPGLLILLAWILVNSVSFPVKLLTNSIRALEPKVIFLPVISAPLTFLFVNTSLTTATTCPCSLVVVEN